MFMLGWILFLGYIVVVGTWWQTILRRLFGFGKDWTTRILGCFAAVLLLSLFASVLAVWYRVTPAIVFGVYLAVFLLSITLYFKARRMKNQESGITNEMSNGSGPESVFKKSILFIFSFVLLSAVELYLLFISKSQASLFSPWQTIHPWYLPLFFILTLLLGAIIFSGHKTKTILACIILHSVVLHAYLPLTHELPWGGDTWRHIGVERKLAAGEFYPPVLLGPEAKYRNIEISKYRNFSVPEALLIPNKYAYGQLWGLSVLVAKTTGLPLETVAKWLVPVFWAIVFPIILCQIGSLLFSSRRSALWLAALGALPFSWQTLGSLSFPVGLGYLSFFFILMLWLSVMRSGNKWQRRLVYALSALMLFGYTLHFLLLWIIIGLTYAAKTISNQQSTMKRIASLTTLTFASLFILPVLEMLTKISYFSASWQPWPALKQFIGQFSGWFYASLIRPHTISSGNFIFFHTPSWAYVENMFTVWRWWVIPAMVSIWLVVLYGLVIRIREWYAPARRSLSEGGNSRMWSVLVLLFTTVVGGYIIGWYVLDGDRTFIRRLDGMMAFVILAFFLSGIQKLSSPPTLRLRRASIIYHLSSIRNLKPVTRNLFLAATMVIFAWFTTSTYASGPDQRVVSHDEYQAASYVWSQLKDQPGPYCVVADTWTLLALEGVSARSIVGGGFPIDYQFGQPERVVLFHELQERPRSSILTVAKKLTGAKRCIGILEGTRIDAGHQKQVDALFGQPGVDIGNLRVWIEVK